MCNPLDEHMQQLSSSLFSVNIAIQADNASGHFAPEDEDCNEDIPLSRFSSTQDAVAPVTDLSHVRFQEKEKETCRLPAPPRSSRGPPRMPLRRSSIGFGAVAA